MASADCQLEIILDAMNNAFCGQEVDYLLDGTVASKFSTRML